MNAQQEAKSSRFVSLRVKLLVGFTVVFTVVFAGAYYWFYQFATDMAMSRIGEDLTDTLHGAAAGVNGDELEALNQEGAARDDGFTDDERYWNQIVWMDTIHSVEPRAWPYTFVAGDRSKNEIVGITDLWARYNPEKAIHFQEVAELDDPEANYGGLITTTLYLDIYSDKWGSWVSGYTPIKNTNGDVVAALGIDFRADYVSQVQQSIINNVAGAFVVTYAALFLLIFVVSRGLTSPVIALTRAAERIGEGDYNQDLSNISAGTLKDEIDTLAQVFGIMVAKVYQREQTLIKQVEELKIEIDETKRKQQVSEIVDTDFFRDMQEKAQALRRRRTEGHKPAPDAEKPG